MAAKATKRTGNLELIRWILDDQTALFIPRLSKGDRRIRRLEHNLRELLRRLGESPDEAELLYCL